MPYVIVLDPNSGKQVPYFVTREQYRYQCRKTKSLPSRFNTLDDAQKACDKVNSTAAGLQAQLNAAKGEKIE